MDEIKYEDLEKSVLIRNSNTKVTCTDYGTTPDGVTEPVIPTDKVRAALMNCFLLFVFFFFNYVPSISSLYKFKILILM